MRQLKFAARWSVRLSIGLLLCAVAATRATAQLDFSSLDPQGAAAPVVKEPVTVTAQIAPAAGAEPAKLVVTADIATGYHIYSITQASGGPIQSKLAIEPGADFKLGDFTADPAPEEKLDAAFPGVTTESHEERVVWSAPLELNAGADLSKLKIAGKLTYGACSDRGCLPPAKVSFTASLNTKNENSPAANVDATADAAHDEPSFPTLTAPVGSAAVSPTQSPDAATEYKPSNAHLVLHGYVTPQAAAPGDTVRLTITAEPINGYHVYALASHDAGTGSKPTLMVLTKSGSLTASAPTAEAPPIERPSEAFKGTTDRFYEQAATFSIELSVPKDAAAGSVELAGLIGYQTCDDTKGCDMPQAAKFTATIAIAAQPQPGEVPLQFAPAESYKLVATAAKGSSNTVLSSPSTGFDPTKLEATSAAGGEPLLMVLIFSFLGGLILNCMPCVLPVIGLKILGFVEQAHHHRSRVLALNLWFSLGLLSVFAGLATLAVFFDLGWGEQYTNPSFKIGLAALVFAMALSFLGVWEIPIPGFVGHGTVGDLATNEGAGGAFAKGVLTTILATPCSGPFLGPVFGLVLSQSPLAIYAIFLSIGLGMASPYLVIGTFPQLIRFLPKPGAWMDTVKQLMAFLLLGTVVYLFMSIQPDYFIPAFTLLIGVWLGCWWAGRTPLTAELGAKLAAWAAGAAMATAVGVFAFTFLVPGKDLLEWQPFSRASLVKLTTEGKTVFVDFTANWCPTCKLNERVAINTQAVRELVDEYHIATLKADWSNESDEIEEMLKLLHRKSIPVYAVFPANQPNRPIIFGDLVSQSDVLEKLREAGPSKDAAQRTALKASR